MLFVLAQILNTYNSHNFDNKTRHELMFILILIMCRQVATNTIELWECNAYGTVRVGNTTEAEINSDAIQLTECNGNGTVMAGNTTEAESVQIEQL